MPTLPARYGVSASIVFCIAATFGAPSLAQNCGALTQGSIVFSSAPTTVLYPHDSASSAIGFNLVEIHGTSPVNDTPGDPSLNGFKQLCTIFSLTGTQSTIMQVNAQTGGLTTFICDQLKAPRFQPCQAVIIWPAPEAASFMGQIPYNAAGHEGTWTYTFYAQVPPNLVGSNLYGIPHSASFNNGSFNDGNLFCNKLSLPAGTVISRYLPQTGGVDQFICGQVQSFWGGSPGEAVLIRPPSTVTSTMPIP